MHYTSSRSRKASRRKNKASSLSSTRTALAFDWLIFLLLLVAPVCGMIMFGAVRVWSQSILQLLIFFAGILFFLRPIFNIGFRTAKMPAGLYPFLIFFVWLVVRFPVAPVKFDALMDILGVGGLFVAYYLWSSSTSEATRWRYTFAVLFIVVSLFCWYALIQHVKGTSYVLNLLRPEQYGMRASGTYICPNHFANVLEMLGCLSIGLILFSSAGVVLRLLAGYALLLILPVILLTQSRSGWLSLLGGGTLTALLILWRKNKKIFYVALVAIPILVGVVFGLVWYCSPVVQERIAGISLSNPDGAINIRFILWKDTLQMIKENVWWGHGAGSYRWLYPHYQTHSQNLWARYAHNEYLHAIAEYGFIGFVLVTIGFVWVLARAVRVTFTSDGERNIVLMSILIGCLVANFIHAAFDYNFHIYANMLLLALIAGISFSRTPLESSPKPIKPIFWWVVNSIALLFCVLMFVQSARTLATYYYNRKGDALLGTFKHKEAREAYQRAKFILPYNYEAHKKHANTYKVRCFWERDSLEKKALADQALVLYEQAAEMNPYDFEIAEGKSVVYQSLGQLKQAEEIFRGVLAFAPNQHFFLNRLGILLRQKGKLKEALEYFQHAQRLENNNISTTNIRRIKKALQEK